MAMNSISAISGYNSGRASPLRLSPAMTPIQLSNHGSGHFSVPNLDLSAQLSAASDNPMSSDEIEHTAPLPAEDHDDDDVVKDMSHHVTAGGPGTSGTSGAPNNTDNLDDGEDGEDGIQLSPEDLDEDNEDYDQFYSKANSVKTPKTPIPDQPDFADDGSSEEQNIDPMYDVNNKTKGNEE
mmetsp:Transcript_60830/g.54820  ORF Transcript_60830/g.54820 Transcript_60830/m.54820 type:complete len:181 (+) Transcript_60830:2-544(+)